jgi:hypothetical protein
MYVSPEARISFPAFDEKYAMIAPGILRRCASATEDLALDSVAVRAAFFAAAATVDRQIRLPVDATAAWDMLRKELYPA